MATWSGMRKKLEREYLAESLRGHIQYYATSYRKSHDHEGRAAIRYDGKEIIKGCYWNNWMKAGLFPRDEKYERRMAMENAYMDDVALKLGVFDQRCFYRAFEEFEHQSIEESLVSNNLIIRIFAILDRSTENIRNIHLLSKEEPSFRDKVRHVRKATIKPRRKC